MKKNKRMFGLKKIGSIGMIVLLVLSALPAGFLMMILPVGAEQTNNNNSENNNNVGGVTTTGTNTITGEAEESDINSYIIYGHVYTNGLGNSKNLTPNALVIFTNMRTGDGNATYANETGYYSFDLAEMNNSYMSGDEIKITATNGIDIMVTNMTIVGNSSEEINIVIDPIPDSMPRPHASPQPEPIGIVEPDLVVVNISFSEDKPLDGNTIMITAAVENIGPVSIEYVNISFYLDVIGNGYLIATKTGNLADYKAEISTGWTATAGEHVVFTVIDPANSIPEADETNNQNMKTITVYSVESLINATITSIDMLKSKLDAKTGKSATNHLDNAINDLQNALNHYTNSSRGIGAPEIPAMEQAVDDVWKAMKTFSNASPINEANNIEDQVIFISGLMVHKEPYQRIIDANKMIMATRTMALIEIPENNDWNVVDNKLGNANHHFFMALKALAEDKDVKNELQQAYDKLDDTKNSIQTLIDQGKIPSGFGEQAVGQTGSAVLLFPSELSVSSEDIVVEGVVAKGYEASITITVHNNGLVSAKNVTVDVYQESEPILIMSYTILKIGAGSSDTTTVNWVPTTDGTHDIRIVLDAENMVVESTKEDNVVSSGVYVASAYLTPRNTEWIIYDLTIVKDEWVIWENGVDVPDYPLQSQQNNVIITTGHLILDNSTLVIVSATDGQYKIQVNQSGRFDVLNGSLVTASQQNFRYNFVCSGILSIEKSEVWYTYGDLTISPYIGGIQLYSTSVCNITDSTVTRGGTHNIYCDGASPRLINSTVSYAGAEEGKGNGIHCINGASPIIEGSTIRSSKKHGVYCDGAETKIRVENSSIYDNVQAGIYVTNSSKPLIKNNSFDIGSIKPLDWVFTRPDHKSGGNTLLVSFSDYKSMMKWDISSIPARSEIISASLHYCVYKNNPGTTISVHHVLDDSWSSDTDASALYTWPITETKTSYDTSSDVGWITVDITKHLRDELISGNNLLSLKWEYSTSGIMHQWCSPVGELGPEPYIEIMYISGGEAIQSGRGGIYDNTYGIYCNDSASPNITWNTIRSNDKPGIYCEYSNLLIDNNTMKWNNDEAVYSYQSSIIVTNNTILKNDGYGGVHSLRSSLIIKGNTIKNSVYGIFSEISSPLTITGNIIGWNSQMGIFYYCSNGTISHNEIISNKKSTSPGIGIYCIDQVEGRKPLIINNNISDSYYGLYCSGYSSPIIKNNNIINTYDGIYTHWHWYSYCPSLAPIIIDSNNIYNNHNGIYIDDETEKITVTNNTISSNDKSGIYCYNSSPIIINNTIKDNSYYGVYANRSVLVIENRNEILANKYGLVSDSSTFTVKNNTIRDNTMYGVYSISSTCEIVNNTIDGNYGGIFFNGSQGNISKNSITDHMHIYVRGTKMGLYDLPVYNPIGYGVYCMNGSKPTIEENEISRNRYGIYTEDSEEINIRNNTIDNNRYAYVVEFPPPWPPWPPIPPHWPPGWPWPPVRPYPGYEVYPPIESDGGVVVIQPKKSAAGVKPIEIPSRKYVVKGGDGIIDVRSNAVIDNNSMSKNYKTITSWMSNTTIANNTIIGWPEGLPIPAIYPFAYPYIGIHYEEAACNITNNTITGFGSYGVYASYNNEYDELYSRSTLISCNNISDNNGIGIYCYYSSPIIANNANISNNEDGIYCTENSNATIINNNITDNSGYGMYFDETSFGDWTVNNVAEARNNPVRLNGNLVDQNQGQLTFSNVKLEINANVNGQHQIEVQNGGKLHISDNSNITAGDPNYHYLFFVRDGAIMEMRNSELHYCGFNHNEWVQWSGLNIQADNVIIDSCLISDNYNGIFAYSYSSPEITNCIIENNENKGITCESDSAATIVNNTIRNNVGWGIEMRTVYSSSIVANNTIISNKKGIFVGDRNDLVRDTPITLINNTITDNEVGIECSQSSWVSIINSLLSNNFVGVASYHVPEYICRVNITNSTIITSTSLDIQMCGSSRVECLNTTFNASKLGFVDGNNILNVSWYLNLKVVDSNNNPIQGAEITVKNIADTAVFTGATNSAGWIKGVPIQEYMNVSGTPTYYTPHTIVASKVGYAPIYKDVSVNETKDVTIMLPGILGTTINSPNGGEIWAGSTSCYSISYTISGGTGPYSIGLYYSTNSGGSFPYTIVTGISKSAPGTYTYSWTTPSITSSEVRVKVVVTDSTTPTQTASDMSDANFIIDSTKPTSYVNAISPYWQTSTPFTITGSASDVNSGVKNVNLYYRFSTDNSTWSSWALYSTDSSSPWSWSFSAPSGDDYYEFYSVAVDNANNAEAAPVSKDSLCGVDTNAPSSSVNMLSPYWQTSTPFTVTASASDGASGVKDLTLYYRYSSDNSSWGGWVSFGTDSISPWSWSFSAPSGDGYYEFYSIAVDNAGLSESAPAGRDSLCGFDNVAPTSSVNTIAPYWHNTSIAITATASDTLSGLKNVTLYYYNSTDNSTFYGPYVFGTDTDPGDGISWSFNFPKGEGYYRFYSIAVDNATNTEQFTVNDTMCGYDATTPTSTIQTPTDNSYFNSVPIWFNGTCSNNLSGVNKVEINITYRENGTVVVPWVSTNLASNYIWWDYIFYPSVEANYTIRVRAIDNASNVQEILPTVNITYDITPPVSSVNPVSPYWQNTSPITLTATASDTISGLKNITLYYYNSTDNITWSGPWDFDTINNPWAGISLSFSFPNGTGYYRFYSIAVDNATNEEIFTANDTGCGYDNILPTSEVNSISPYWNTTGTINIIVTASDTVSGIKEVALYYNYSADNLTGWTGWTLYDTNDTTYPYEWIFSAPNGDGYYQFYSIGVDHATNTESMPATPDAIAGVDTTIPISYVNVISPYWNVTGTIDIVVTASDENITGGESGIKEVALYYRNSSDNISWSAWTLYDVNTTASPYQWSFVSPGDGYYEFYSIAVDNASNIELTPATNDTICGIDTTPPIANAGADQTVPEDTLVTFNGTGSSDNLGIGNYTWTFTDQVTPVTLYTVNPTYTFYTPGNYSVLLNVTDYAGNWNTDTMWVNVTDTTKPISNATVPGNPWKNIIPFNVDWNATDNYNLSSVKMFYRYSPDNSIWGAWISLGNQTADGVSDNGTFSFNAPDGEGYYQFYTIATDDAGNVEPTPAAADTTAVYDITPPIIISTSPFDTATTVSPNQPIIIEFSESMNTSTVTYTCAPDPGGWSSSWNIPTNDTLTLTHVDFATTTTYTFEITGGQDLAGNTLATGMEYYATGNINNGATNPENVQGRPDDQYATIPMNVNTGNYVRGTGYSTGTGDITKVEIIIEYHMSAAAADDKLELKYTLDGGATYGTSTYTVIPTSIADVQYILNVTADRAWTWTDISKIEVYAGNIKTGGADSVNILVDALWVNVTTAPNPWSFTTGTVNVDYITIRDAPNNGGNPVGDVTYDEDTTGIFYAAAYNLSTGYIGDLSVTWTSNDTSVGIVTSPGNSTTFTPVGVGVCRVTASCGLITNTTGILTVIDTVPPKATISTPSEGVNINYFPLKISGSCSDNLSGINRVEINITNKDTGENILPWTNTTLASNHTWWDYYFLIQNYGYGNYIINVTAFDNAGNIQIPISIVNISYGPVITNGNFTNDLTGWTQTPAVVFNIAWFDSGDPQYGCARGSTSAGTAVQSDNMKQTFDISEIPINATLSFKWRKWCTGNVPTTQTITLELIEPDGTTVAYTWSNTITQTTVGTTPWYLVTVNVTGSITVTGTWTIKLSWEMKNGKATARTGADWDDVNITLEIDPPSDENASTNYAVSSNVSLDVLVKDDLLNRRKKVRIST